MKSFILITFLALFGAFVVPAHAQDKADKADTKVPYSHASKKLGKSYYLFSKDVKLKNSDKVRRIYYFAKEPTNAKGKPVLKLPEDRMVSETKTGMLVLKKKPAKPTK